MSERTLKKLFQTWKNADYPDNEFIKTIVESEKEVGNNLLKEGWIGIFKKVLRGNASALKLPHI